nr:lactate utilization protein [Alkaliphilus transvaalensis]
MNLAVENLIKKLEEKKFKVKYFEKKEEAIESVLAETVDDHVVGIGGSMTIKELELHEILKGQGKEIYWHWLVEPQERNAIRQKANNADVYLSSTNALTEAGELVNIDGLGNRVSGMFYGPKKVIVICGINKITSDYNTAIERIKKSACPSNARRLGLKTPCAATGECNDCLSPDRMCNITTIISHKPMAIDFHIYLIGENLGY